MTVNTDAVVPESELKTSRAIESIRKRDGRTANFDQSKIKEAICKAFKATYKPNSEDVAEKLAGQVLALLETEGNPVPDVEHIQDVVEQVLMD
ncbi:MAG: hypothetical protein LBN43_03505, partial [Oscillospiraceae bacterium]|nr:hypothetical protein [Oscillospiraceae bacterium]